MYSDVITLFNRYHSASGDTWYPTVIHSVDLNADKAAITAVYGDKSGDNARLHIRFQTVDGRIYIAGKPYFAPKKWNALLNDTLGKAVTFQSGTDFDFFALGEFPEVPVNDEEYKKGFYNYMVEHEDYVYAITSVGGPYNLIPHFEILGK